MGNAEGVWWKKVGRHLETGRSLLDIVAIKQELEALLGRKVDVLTESSLSPYLREQILMEAIRL